MPAVFDQVDLVGRIVVAELFLAGVGRPHASRGRIPVEADRVVETRRRRCGRRCRGRRTPGWSCGAGRPRRTRCTTSRCPRRAGRRARTRSSATCAARAWTTAASRSVSTGPAIAPAAPLRPQHRGRRADVEIAVLEGHAVRVAETAQQHRAARPRRRRWRRAAPRPRRAWPRPRCLPDSRSSAARRAGPTRRPTP